MELKLRDLLVSHDNHLNIKQAVVTRLNDFYSTEYNTRKDRLTGGECPLLVGMVSRASDVPIIGFCTHVPRMEPVVERIYACEHHLHPMYYSMYGEPLQRALVWQPWRL